ncbi:phosphatidylserine/phosphatidylglycerophosphate/cardiolipin synthase family protein [Micrococcus flavus]|uniref:Cardiolipin synthase n=1 Tax=Micrococcus flavus TaxID=384602 RepID=A0A4Y8WUQ9_9MICC|nr:phospholipase D-like domain-containing protein [Micrococcus flavus]MBB4881691.1 cardiolipin synthase [Micrococcus flavus]TFH98728.1 phosphatidylserine/phosphatidylglycerophosphate/cardiolipin synthase family protein [Micrococcus flavus]GGK54100.1 cardiolipin synthase B [Micrococcus flavus]
MDLAQRLRRLPTRRPFSVRAALRRSVTVGAVGLVVVPIATAIALTGYDLVKRRGRRLRPVRRPGTYEAQVGSDAMTLFTSGEDVYDAMIEAIDAAEETVKFETYIWKADDTGQRFVDALNRAAARGVQVWASYDGFANLVVPSRFFRQFDPRVQVYRLPAFTRPYWRGLIRYTGFNHSKVLVVDGDVGFVGGYNVGEVYAKHWRDTHVRIQGPAVWGLDRSIVALWNEAHIGDDSIPWAAPRAWETDVSVHANLPAQLVYPIRNSYLSAIDRATRHIYINTPYFIPDQQVLGALKSAAQRGVDVQVMVPKDSNHVVSDWVSRGFYTEMLEAGITILLYAGGMIHAKTATVDGVWSTVGTANIDRLSLSFNYETNVVVVDPDFAARMEEIFRADAQHAERVESPRWGDRHGLARVVETLLVPLRPLL